MRRSRSSAEIECGDRVRRSSARIVWDIEWGDRLNIVWRSLGDRIGPPAHLRDPLRRRLLGRHLLRVRLLRRRALHLGHDLAGEMGAREELRGGLVGDHMEIGEIEGGAWRTFWKARSAVTPAPSPTSSTVEKLTWARDRGEIEARSRRNRGRWRDRVRRSRADRGRILSSTVENKITTRNTAAIMALNGTPRRSMAINGNGDQRQWRSTASNGNFSRGGRRRQSPAARGDSPCRPTARRALIRARGRGRRR